MIKFIVVDDNKDEIKHIEELLNEVVEKKKILKFTNFSNELKAEINNLEERKIYILDIELGNSKVSGINIAKFIRDVDWESEIIFITNHDKMFESVYRNINEVYDFIEKFHDFDRKFKKDIRAIIKRNFDNKMFKYKTSNNIDLSIYYRSILYIYRETEDRKLVIVTDKNKYLVSLNLKDIFEYLDDRFILCHRSCIVNKLRIQEKNFKDGYFTLDTGEKVYMLSKKYKEELEV